LAQERFRCQVQLYGTVCRLTIRPSTVCQSFVVVVDRRRLKIVCSIKHTQALLKSCIFYIVAYRSFLLNCTSHHNVLLLLFILLCDGGLREADRQCDV